MKITRNRQGVALTYKVPAAKGRRLVVPDIHGCPETFTSLLETIQLQERDQLFLLGDYIDRGPSSSGVIDIIMKLQQQYSVYPLRGNHEQMLLDLCQNSPEQLRWARQYHGSGLLQQQKPAIKPVYLQFLQDLPHYVALKDYILVHAGLNCSAPDPFQRLQDLVWIRNFTNEPRVTGGRTIVHGHPPTSLPEIRHAIKTGSSIIPLDNGCVFASYRTDVGNLLCLDIDSRQLYIQRNLTEIVI